MIVKLQSTLEDLDQSNDVFADTRDVNPSKTCVVVQYDSTKSLLVIH